MLLWETFHAYPLLLLLWLPINVESFHLFSHFDLPCQGTHTLIYIKFPLFMVVLWYYNVRYLPQQHLRYLRLVYMERRWMLDVFYYVYAKFYVCLSFFHCFSFMRFVCLYPILLVCKPFGVQGNLNVRKGKWKITGKHHLKCCLMIIYFVSVWYVDV